MKSLSLLWLLVGFSSHATLTSYRTDLQGALPGGFHQGQMTPWQNIEVKQKLFLNRDLKVSDDILLKKGTHFDVTEVTSLDMIRVELYELSLVPCTGPMQKKVAEIGIVDDLYGVAFGPKCNLDVYVEFADFARPSFFGHE